MTERVGSYYYLFPTYAQGKKILWLGADKQGFKFLNHFPKQLVKRVDNGEMLAELINGSIFQIIGTDKIDSIVGTNPIGCVFSEYSVQNPKAWDFLRPILAENGGWAIFNYTPRGKNHGYDLYEMAKGNPKWFVQKLTVDDTGAITPDVIQEERDSGMSEEMIQQEYYCSFTAAIMGAYYWKEYDDAEKAGRFVNVPYDPTALVHTVWDLGIRDSMAIGFYQGVGLERRKIDYVELTGKGLPEAIKYVKEKPYTYGKHFAPHDIQVRELGTGKSRLEVAKELGISFEIVPNISVQDELMQDADSSRNSGLIKLTAKTGSSSFPNTRRNTTKIRRFSRINRFTTGRVMELMNIDTPRWSKIILITELSSQRLNNPNGNQNQIILDN